MSVWTVRMPSGEDERIEAAIILLESGALMALSEESLIVRAWAPGEWRTVRHIDGADVQPADKEHGNFLVGIPQG